MKREIKISVVTVCRNEAETIERTIRSVVMQTYPHLEYVIIDGHSTDGTLEIVRRYQDVCRFRSEPDNGIYDAMNKGVKYTTGDYIIFINAGDYLIHKEVLQKCATYMNETPALMDVFYGNLYSGRTL